MNLDRYVPGRGRPSNQRKGQSMNQPLAVLVAFTPSRIVLFTRAIFNFGLLISTYHRARVGLVYSCT